MTNFVLFSKNVQTKRNICVNYFYNIFIYLSKLFCKLCFYFKNCIYYFQIFFKLRVLFSKNIQKVAYLVNY